MNEKLKQSEFSLTALHLNQIIVCLDKLKRSGESLHNDRYHLIEKQLEVMKSRKSLTLDKIRINGLLKQLETISKKIKEILCIERERENV